MAEKETQPGRGEEETGTGKAEPDAKTTAAETEKAGTLTGEDSIHDRLVDLQSQLDALRTARTADAEGDRPADEEPPAGAAAADLSGQIQEFIDGLDRDLKDTHPTTLLAVFGLGILVGRLLPR